MPIDFLLDACVIITGEGSGPGGAPLDPISGLGRDQLASVDAFRLRLVPPLTMALTPGAIAIPALLAALAIIGAVTVAQTIVALVGLAAVAAALGVIGPVVAVVAGIALGVFIAVAVPPTVESFAKSKVEAQFSSGLILEQLNDQPLVRYAGEGAAEAIARTALARARDLGFNVPSPAGSDADEVGLDRFHGQLFQMIFVSDGVCRVLLRLDDCLDQVRTPQPPDRPGDDHGPLDLTIGVRGRRATGRRPA